MSRRPTPQVKPEITNPRLKRAGFFDSQQVRSDIYRIHRLFEKRPIPPFNGITRAALERLHRATWEVKSHHLYKGDPHVSAYRRFLVMMDELDDRVSGSSFQEELAALCEEFATSLEAYLSLMTEWRQRYLRRPSE